MACFSAIRAAILPVTPPRTLPLFGVKNRPRKVTPPYPKFDPNLPSPFSSEWGNSSGRPRAAGISPVSTNRLRGVPCRSLPFYARADGALAATRTPAFGQEPPSKPWVYQSLRSIRARSIVKEVMSSANSSVMCPARLRQGFASTRAG